VKGMKFILTRANYKDVMDRIKADNASLCRLAKQRNELEMPRRGRNRRFDTGFYERIRQTTSDMFKCLTSTLACPCSTPHHINLELLHRKHEPLVNGEIAANGKNISFDAIFSDDDLRSETTTGSSTSSVSWKEIQLAVATIESPITLTTEPNLNRPGPVLNRTNTVTQGKATSKMRTPQRSVQFMSQTTSSSASGSSSVATTSLQSTISGATIELTSVTTPSSFPTVSRSSVISHTIPAVARAASTKATYLCHELHKQSTTNGSKDSLALPIDTTKECRLWWNGIAVSGNTQPVMTLRAILGGKVSNVPEFCLADRLSAAVTLASSVLQLPELTWPGLGKMKSHVIFIQRKDPKPYKEIFLSKQFPTQNSPSGNTEEEESMPYIRNLVIFALGITLIELCFRKPIEDLRTTDPLDDNGTINGLTRLSIAKRLLDGREIQQRTGDRYETAVRRCIFCDFDQQCSTLDDKQFQSAFYEDVVVLLEEALMAFNSTI
jgi:hypothetical protein